MSLPHRLLAWRPGAYIRASAGLFGWLLLRAAAQAAMVLLLARVLGAGGYGHFVTVLALAGFFAPLAGLGLHGVILRDGARAPELLPKLIGASLELWWRSTVVISLTAAAVVLWVLPAGTLAPAAAAFAVAEVASSSLVELAARVEQSQHHTQRFGAIMAGLVLARLIGLGGYAYFFNPEVNGWMWVYAGASSLYAVGLFLWLKAEHRPIRGWHPGWALVKEGLPFTVGALSFRLQAEFNKPVLAQLGFAQAGNFSAAQRVVDLASLPLQALQETLWSRLYASEYPGRRMLFMGGVLVALALVGGVTLTFAAPLLPRVLGPGFDNAASLLVWLAWLPAVQVVRNLSNFSLINSGKSYVLAWTQVGGTLPSVAATLWLVPNFGIVGAVVAGYAAELIILIIQEIWRNISIGGEP